MIMRVINGERTSFFHTTFLTELNHSQYTPVPKKVELASFPGFDEQKPIPLPNNISPSVFLTKVFNTNTPTIESVYRAAVRKNLFSDISVRILQDLFWFWFCHYFQPLKDAEDSLHNRIASNFIKLILQINFARDEFFKVYHDFIAQAIFSAFYTIFPKSLARFDYKFIDELVKHITFWVTGKTLTHVKREHWNFRELTSIYRFYASDYVTDSALFSKASTTFFSKLSSINLGSKDGNIKKPSAKVPSLPIFKTTRTLDPSPSSTPRKADFNALQNSPLVEHFMKVNGLNSTTPRTHFISHTTPSPRMKFTHKEIAIDTARKAKQATTDYNKFKTSIAKERSTMVNDRIKQAQEVEKEMASKMASSVATKTLTARLVTVMLGDSKDVLFDGVQEYNTERVETPTDRIVL
eukprot:TRINITY_DN910_c0_g1_i3.p1 TRINITY_DN910_c0_g1~~TRINITY_DN910_c0_g1_i3.p1  ORF type:complete len:409 (-),score=69.36 TRINITY_DN910_c0_g1_i3:79-1305(-)